MGHLNGILAQVGGNLNNNFQKSQMPGGLPGGGMLKLRFDRYISPWTGSTEGRAPWTWSTEMIHGPGVHVFYTSLNDKRLRTVL